MSLRTERWKRLLDNRRDTAQELEPPRVGRRVAIDTFCAVYLLNTVGRPWLKWWTPLSRRCVVSDFFLNERQT